MPSRTEVTCGRLNLSVRDVDLGVAVAGRSGKLAPVVFLHGFGSTKEDYVDIAYDPAFAGQPFLAYDAPGCGETACGDLSQMSIQYSRLPLRPVDIARRVIGHRCRRPSDLGRVRHRVIAD